MPSEIILPAGTEFVETANIPVLIAEALNPKPANEPRLGRQTESDSAEVKSAAFRRYQVEGEHRAMMCCAIVDGKLKALSRSTRRRVTVHEPDSIVMVSELAKYVEQFGISVTVTDKTEAAHLQAAYDETGLNGNAINWRYWVHQLPVISAAQAACLMSALEPDLFANLDGRNWQDNPARIDPARNIEKARKIQRLAEAQGKPSASPAEWVGWAQAQSLEVHTGFLLAIEELPETTSVQGDAAAAAKGNDRGDVMASQDEYVKNVEEEKAGWDLAGKENDVKQEIIKWEQMNHANDPIKAKIQDDKLDDLRTELADIERRFKSPKGKAAQGTNQNGDDWRVQARAIADECFDRDTANGCRDKLDNYSKRVMVLMQERGIKGPRGIFDRSGTIKREALQSKHWWANKSK